MSPTYKANKEIFLYNLRSTLSGFAMAKLDSDWNVAAVYNLAPSRNGHFSCDCPANARAVITKPCKHRRMLPMMLGAVNTDRFYDPENGSWCQPLGDLHRVDLEQVVGEAAPLPIDPVAVFENAKRELEAAGVPDPVYVPVPDPNPVRIPSSAPTLRRR